MVKNLAAKFAREKVAPLVKEMDEKEELDRSIIDGLFEQGVSNAVFNGSTSTLYLKCTQLVL